MGVEMTDVLRPQMVIDGEEVAGDSGTYAVQNPAQPTETVVEAPSASLQQLDAAVAGARRAQPAWGALDFDERFDALTKASAAVQQAVESEDLANLLTREHGKVLWEATFDAGTLATMSSAFEQMAREAVKPSLLSEGPPSTTVERRPMGVVAALLPFNWPVAVLGNKLIPALLTGNTAVVKPPPTCPAAVLRAVTAIARSLPAGVVNVVNGPGSELGSALVSHAGVDMISFTGGVTTGRAVMTAAAQCVKPVVLELGGNDPAIVAPDVSINDQLADRLVNAAFVTSGQVCMAIKRLYVHESSLAQMQEALVERVGKETIGNGLDPAVTMGPVHQPAARDRVEEMVAEAAERGASVQRPAKLADDAQNGGYFVSPAIVAEPRPDARIVIEEQFAPALPIIPYSDIESAVASANQSSYGLCASIWSNDDDLAKKIGDRLEAGTVFINTHGMSAMDPRAPFGGWKQSGFGLELGVEGMRAFTHPRTVLTYPGPNPGG